MENGGVGGEGRGLGRAWGGVENSIPGLRVETGGGMSPQPEIWACFLHFLPASHPSGSAVGQLHGGQGVGRAGSSQTRQTPDIYTNSAAKVRERVTVPP